MFLHPFSKVRRLGYLILMVDFFQQNHGKYSVWKFGKAFGFFAQSHERHLSNYRYKSGDIIATAKSVKPYTTFAHELGIIKKYGNEYELSSDQLTHFESGGNPFRIVGINQRILTHKLFKLDAKILSLLLRFIETRNNQESFNHFRLEWNSFIQNRIENGEIFEPTLFQYLESTITSTFFFESAIITRIHWLADLNYVELEEASEKTFAVTISALGRQFVNSIDLSTFDSDTL